MNKNKTIIFIVFFLLIISVHINAQPITWQRIYNYENGNDFAHDAIQTLDGGYLFVGDGRSTSVFKGAFLLKLDYLGNLEWKKLIGGVNEGRSVNKVTQLSDSSYLLVGNTYDSLLLFKTNKRGEVEWEKKFCEPTGEARGYSLRVMKNGNIIICGDVFFKTPTLRIYPYIIKTDIDGNLKWKRYYEDMLNINPSDIISLNNSELIFCAEQYLRWLDSLGNVVKTKSYWSGSGILSLIDLEYVEPDIIYSGGVSRLDSRVAFHALKINIIDSLYWNKRFVSPDSIVAEGYGLCYSNGNIYMTGVYNKKGVIPFVKISSNGDLGIYTLIDEFPEFESYASSIRPSNDGGFIIGATITIGPPFSSKFLAIKTDSNGYAPKPVSIQNSNILTNQFELFQNYPNPFNPTTNIEYLLNTESDVLLELFNVTGKKILDLENAKKTSGPYTVKFDGSNLPSGIYFYKLTTKSNNNFKNSITKKMVLLK